MRLTAVAAGLLLCLGVTLAPITQGFPVLPRPEIESSLMRVMKDLATSLQHDVHLGDSLATHQIISRRLPAEDQGFGSAPTTGWGDAPQSGMGEALKIGMGNKPKAGLGGKPKEKVGKKPKHGKGAKPKQEMGEKPRGFCNDCPPPVRIASPANDVPDSTSTVTGGFPSDRVMTSSGKQGSTEESPPTGDDRSLASNGRTWVKRQPSDRVMQSDGQTWGRREVSPEVQTRQERRAENDLGESSKPSEEIVWDKRADPPPAPSASTSKETEYEWQRREELPEASTSYEDVRLDGDVPIPTDAAEQLALANDFEWSRRSPELADPAKREKGRAAAPAGARWSGMGTAPETPTPDTDPEREGHSNGFIMVDKRSPRSSKPTFLVPVKRDHSDILWEFIPEDQTHIGSV